MNKLVILTMIASMLAAPALSLANPAVSADPVHPGSFERVEPGHGHSFDAPAWCYDDDANSILLLAGEKEKIRCELKLAFELEKEKFKSKLIIDNLNLRIEILTKEHKKILMIKDQEVERLTEITLRVPNDHSAWWATGGFVVGILTTIAITYAVHSE